MQLQLVLDLDGLGDAARERAVGVAPLVPDLGGRRVDQVVCVCLEQSYGQASASLTCAVYEKKSSHYLYHVSSQDHDKYLVFFYHYQ